MGEYRLGGRPQDEQVSRIVQATDKLLETLSVPHGIGEQALVQLAGLAVFERIANEGEHAPMMEGSDLATIISNHAVSAGWSASQTVWVLLGTAGAILKKAPVLGPWHIERSPEGGA